MLLVPLLAATAATPHILYALNATNINSGRNKEVVQTGVGNEWLKVLGRTPSLEACGALCVAYAVDGLRCRSFTRFSSGDNASLCFGHTSFVWQPQCRGDGAVSAGLVQWPCEDDLGCSLNGACNGGLCECNSGWKGERCELLDLAPVEGGRNPSTGVWQLGFSPMADGRNMSSWGGSVQHVDGDWHMFAVEMTNHCGIGSYLVNSGVVHAVSKSGVLGPYEKRDAILPPFAHEPCVARAPTGELVMVTVSGELNGHASCVCETGATSSGCEECDNACHPQIPTLSVAFSPVGPWRHHPLFPDSTHGENPVIWIAKNGSAFGMGRGGHMAAFAADWRNASGWSHQPFGAATGAKTFISDGPNVEDPFLYQDEAGNFHALFHDLDGPRGDGCGDAHWVGTHAFSKDGLGWHYGGRAYDNLVNLTDGGTLLLGRRERPHLVFAEGSRTPIALSTSAQAPGPWGDRTFTIVQGVVQRAPDVADVSVHVTSFDPQPVVSYPANSAFAQVFNPAWVGGHKPGLLLRTQNCSARPGECVHCSGPGPKASVLTFAALQSSDNGGDHSPTFAPITAASVVFGPHDDTDDLGTEDPRVAYDADHGMHYMFYTCYNSGRTRHPTISLCLASTADPSEPSGWTRHGPVGLPQGSKSGALLLRPATAAEPDPEHILLWGAGIIHLSRSRNLSHWPEGVPFITNTSWGNPNVESGPPPLLLTSGDYIFFHNSWNAHFPAPPGYQPAWVILSGDDPSRILAHATEPLWSPQRAPWLTGTPPAYCNVPNVAFVEAAHPTSEPDTFRLYFGGADAVVGTAVVRVEPPGRGESGGNDAYHVRGSE